MRKLFRIEDTCAKALNLKEELRSFDVAKEAFFKVCSPDNVNKLMDCYSDLAAKARGFPDTELHAAVHIGDLSKITALAEIPGLIRGDTFYRSVDVPGKKRSKTTKCCSRKR